MKINFFYDMFSVANNGIIDTISYNIRYVEVAIVSSAVTALVMYIVLRSFYLNKVNVLESEDISLGRDLLTSSMIETSFIYTCRTKTVCLLGNKLILFNKYETKNEIINVLSNLNLNDYYNNEVEIEEEFLCVMSDKSKQWYKINATVVFDKKHKSTPIRIVGRLYCNEHKRKAKQLLINQAHKDHLTGLFNRTYSENEIINHFKISTRGYLLILDVDDFKGINDAYGHLKGDEVLIFIGKCINEVFFEDCIVSRWGGDEFLVYLYNDISVNEIENYMQILKNNVSVYTNDFTSIKITLSIGIAKNSEGDQYKEVLNRADRALYRTKSNGKNGYCYMDKED